MIQEKEIKALINLLDDPDANVFESIQNKIISAGTHAIPHLEAKYGLDGNNLINSRIETLIEDIKNGKFLEDFENWFYSNNNQKLIYGLYYINSLYYHDTKFDDFKNELALVRNKIWLELKDNLTGFEAIKILNRYIYSVSGYSVEKDDKKNRSALFPEHLFIHKKVSPFPFIGLYCLIAESLKLPVYPVYLPGLILMAYVNKDIAREAYGSDSSGVLFYINPYDSGSFLGRKALNYVIKTKKIDAEEKHFEPLDYQSYIKKYINYLDKAGVFKSDKATDRRFIKMLEIVNK